MPNIQDQTDFLGLTPKQDFQVGVGIGAAGDLFGGIGDFLSGQASASAYKTEEQWVQEATALQLYMQKRQAYRVQSQAEAQIGAAGLAGGGSAEEIIRMNASNLALDAGMIAQKGGEEAGLYGMKARAAETAGWGGLVQGVLKGGASLITAGIL